MTYAHEYAAHVAELARYEQWAGREAEYRYHRAHRTLDDLEAKAEGLGAAAIEISARASVQVPSERVAELRRRSEAARKARAVEKRMLIARGQGSAEGSETA